MSTDSRVEECRLRGWFAICAGRGLGWRPCPRNTPGATEDLNRLAVFQQTDFDGYYEDHAMNPWTRHPDAVAVRMALSRLAAEGAPALPVIKQYIPDYAAAVERAAKDYSVRVEDVTAAMLAHTEMALWGEVAAQVANRSSAPTGVRFEYRQGPSPGGVAGIGGPGLEMNGTIILRGGAGGVRMAGASSKAPPWPTVLAEGAGAVCAMLGTLSLIFRVWDERVAKETTEAEEREADAAQLRALMASPPSDLNPDGWQAAVLALAEPPFGDATWMMPSIIPALRRLARGDGTIPAILANHAAEYGSALAASIALHAYDRATATVRPVGPGRSGATWKTRAPKLTVDDGRDE